MEKCTCAHLIGAASGGSVEECGDCRHFGDLDDPLADPALSQEAGDNVYTVADVGNHPSFKYILKHTWRSG